MSDEESRSAHKRMWKITPGVFIVFLRIALKRPYNKNLINLDRSVITGKSQTSALMYWPRYRSVKFLYIKASIWDFPLMTSHSVNK